MRRAGACILLLPLLAAAPLPAQNDEGIRSELRRVIGEARDRVFPALVSIRAVTVQFGRGREFKGRTVGSGVIISPRGDVLTNYHVAHNGRRFFLTLSDRREVEARVLGEDPFTDLALLRFDVEDLKGPVPVAALGRSGELRIGDYVLAMGSPFALSRSVSLGIVSNTERVFAGGFGNDEPGEMEIDEGQRTGVFTRWIQHDALIQPGNSGGPLVNLAGEVVGINQLGGASIGFAIPSDLAREVVAALQEHGEVSRSRVGMSFKPIERTGLEKGVLISSVDVDGPAAQAGIEAGDVLLEIDGEPVTVRFTEEVPPLLHRLASLPVGSRIALLCGRDGRRVRADVTTRRLEKDVGEETSLREWGITAQEITSKMARDRRLDDARGVLVTGVRAGGPAQLAEPSLWAGDVVRRLNGADVPGLKDLIARYEELTPKEPEPLLVEFERQGKSYVTLLEPRQEDGNTPPRELPKAWIGVATQPLLPDLAGRLGLGETGGFRVTRVYPGTKAAGTALRAGDLIVAVGDKPTRPRTVHDAGLLSRMVRSLGIGETQDLKVVRQGETMTIPVVLERTRIGADEAPRYRDPDFEIDVREVTFFDRDENRWGPAVRGVLAEHVEPGGWAGLGGIEPGDLIVRVSGVATDAITSFRSAMQAVEEQRPDRVEVVVLRGIRTYFQYLEPDWTPATRKSREDPE